MFDLKNYVWKKILNVYLILIYKRDVNIYILMFFLGVYVVWVGIYDILILSFFLWCNIKIVCYMYIGVINWDFYILKKYDIVRFFF